MTLKHIFKGTKWDVPCERCAKPLSECLCPPPPPPAASPAPEVPKKAHRLLVRVEKRPKGKKVTVLSGLPFSDRDALLSRLKALCGAGGTIKDGRLEVQGEHKTRVLEELARQGYEATEA